MGSESVWHCLQTIASNGCSSSNLSKVNEHVDSYSAVR